MDQGTSTAHQPEHMWKVMVLKLKLLTALKLLGKAWRGSPYFGGQVTREIGKVTREIGKVVIQMMKSSFPFFLILIYGHLAMSYVVTSFLRQQTSQFLVRINVR